MSVLNREDYITRINAFVGDNSSDEALEFLGDMTDTYNALEQSNSDNENWKQKYEDNDKEWREKYRARFNAPIDEVDDDVPTPRKNKNITFDDLFTTKE